MKKVDEYRGGTRGERREEAGSYACSAPPTLSETQDSTCPPSSRRTATRKSAGLVVAFAIPIPPSVSSSFTARRALDINPTADPRERDPEYRKRETRLRDFGATIETTGAHLWVLSGRHRHVGDERDCTPGKKCARSWCDYRY